MRRRRSKKPARQWTWRWRERGPPALVEQLDDGRWRVVIGICEGGVVASRDAAQQLFDKLARPDRPK
jgi:hypothetical protein